ncbi:hypothetical protein Acsp01_86250 [Actinoplanes sp. NBRC 101535]|nr:hypothetical protein Acsp01_86250 [Actinoplanes sp. NBRC 101535]
MKAKPASLAQRWATDEVPATVTAVPPASSLVDRMDGGYQPPVLAEPAAGPVPGSTGGEQR